MRDIIEWAQSRYGFYVDRHYQAGKWILKPGPINLADYHARILRHCFTPDGTGKLPYGTVLWCEPAKSGKSAIAGLVAEYIALHGEQNSTIVMASNKQNQAASLMFKSLTDSIGYNAHLPRVDPGKFEANFSNGNVVKAIASNSRGAAGERFSLAVFDELWGYVHQDAERLWTEFKVDPTRLNSVRLAIGYAGYTESKLWLELLEGGLRGQPVNELADITNPDGAPACWANGRMFAFWSHTPRQPWQTPQWLAQQQKTLRPAEYRRMIECFFVEGEGNFIDADTWAALVDPAHRPLPPNGGQAVYIGLDLATAAGGDDCALVGVYHEAGKVKVAFHRVWQGKQRQTRLKLTQTVKPYLLRARDQYNLRGVWFDPFQALHLAEELRAAGIPCYEVSQTHANRGPKDTALLEMAHNGQLVLYDAPELKNAAAGANAKELGNGLIFLRKASGRAKIDLLVALSNVGSEALYPSPPPAGDLVEYDETEVFNIYGVGRRSIFDRWIV